jgi:hypothetical protein
LWKAFIRIKSCNKKILNIIFGFSLSSYTESEYILLAGEFKEFRKVKEKYGS